MNPGAQGHLRCRCQTPRDKSPRMCHDARRQIGQARLPPSAKDISSYKPGPTTMCDTHLYRPPLRNGRHGFHHRHGSELSGRPSRALGLPAAHPHRRGAFDVAIPGRLPRLQAAYPRTHPLPLVRACRTRQVGRRLGRVQDRCRWSIKIIGATARLVRQGPSPISITNITVGAFCCIVPFVPRNARLPIARCSPSKAHIGGVKSCLAWPRGEGRSQPAS
jgi:hypothetical protein